MLLVISWGLAMVYLTMAVGGLMILIKLLIIVITISIKKGLKSATIIFLTGLLAMQYNNLWFIALVPVIEVILNWLKHS